jgi:hydroxymethylglutaryl-CoA reductase (NADPH)
MAESSQRAAAIFTELTIDATEDALVQRLAQNQASPPPRIDHASGAERDKLEIRWEVLNAPEHVRAALADLTSVDQAALVQRNIDNYIGTVKVPVGIAGPLRVNGLFARGDFFLPMATTEAAVVAAHSRAAALLTAAGGVTAAALNERVLRSPMFAFRNLSEAGTFAAWVARYQDHLRAEAEATTHHGKLIDISIHIEGNQVYLIFGYTTADASGQNIVTIATEAACQVIERNCPIRFEKRWLEGNVSGDKKASAQAMLGARGKKVVAEAFVTTDLLRKFFNAMPQDIVDYCQAATLGGMMMGQIGANGHIANTLAALYIATGQDAACVAESAVGIMRFEERDDGLYAALTLPNIMVGTVGGGTSLQSQRACLELLGLSGAGSAKALAELAASLCLAGELSIAASTVAGDFTRTHKLMAMARKH